MRTETSVMRFTLTIDCDNAAFGEMLHERAAEIRRILNDVSERLASDEYTISGKLRDVNGNTVGRFWFEE